MRYFRRRVKKPRLMRKSSSSRSKNTDISPRQNSTIDQIMLLQRTIGNQAVQRMLQGSGVRDQGAGPGIQAKLKISQPGDKYEQEADRVADQVMRMPESQVQRQAVEEEEEEEQVQAKSLNDYISPLVQRQVEPEEEEEETIQGKEESGESPDVSQDVANQIHGNNGGGQPLPESVRSFFEPRFGHDFSKVRVHTSGRSKELAHTLNAQAFTTGSDILFASGHFAPGSSVGKRLLAHELTHVVQQGKSKQNAVNRQISLPTISVKRNCKPMLYRKEDIDKTVGKLEGEHKKPKDMSKNEAAEIGREALRTIGYDEIIKFAIEAGLLERKESTEGETRIQRQLSPSQDIIFRQPAEAVTFGSVFTRYAIAAGITSQLDSPAPGPGDLIALGILAVGVIAAGATVLMSKGGKQNVADTGIMEEVHALIAAGTTATICAALEMLMANARRSGDTQKIGRIKATQKTKGCRHRGGG